MQSFDEWFENNDIRLLCKKDNAEFIYNKGQQSRQAEIDELQGRIDKVLVEINEYYDSDGMSDLVFFDISHILKR